MSRERIKGLSIDLDLNTIKVDSGLKDLRSKLRLVNSEMRANMSAFDYADKSIGKYETRLTGLNKKLAVQAEVTEKARNHYKKMVDEHGEGSAEAEKAAVAYNKEAASLNNLERYVGKATSELQAMRREQEIQSTTLWKAGDALESFGDHLGAISEKARSAGSALTKYLTLPIAGVVATVGGMGFKRAMDIEQVDMMIDHISDSKDEATKRMKDIVSLVTDTRFGTAEVGNEYAKFIGASASDTSANIYSQVAMNLSAFKSDDQLIPQIGDLFSKALQSGKIDGTMINQFTSAGVDIIKVLGNKWGMGTDEVKKKLSDGSIDIHDVLDELSEGVLEGTEGELGVTKAMGGMLEKSGGTLSGQLKNFRSSISQMGERLIKDTGMFDGVKDALDDLRKMLNSTEFDGLLIPTFQALATALEALVVTFRKVFKWFSSLSDGTKKFLGTLVGFSAVIGPILVGLGTFGGIIAKISSGLGVFFQFLAPIVTPLKTIAPVAATGGKSVGLLARAFTLLTGPVGLVIGIVSILATAFTIAYKKSDTFREFINNLGNKIKEVFFGIIEWVQPGISAVTNLFKEIKEKSADFISNDSENLMLAFGNIKDFTILVFGYIGEFIKQTFDFIKAVIEFSMPFIEFIIESVWGMIESIITGTLDIIIGAIQIFSGIFTGNWEKLWEGIKNIGSGIIEIIWGIIKNSFMGRIILGIIEFAFSFLDKIKGMWSNVYNKFLEMIIKVYNTVKDSFVGRIIASVVGFVANFRQNITNMWNTVKANFDSKISEIRNSIANSFVGRMLESVRTLKTNFVNIAKDMWQGVKEQFNKIVDGAKALPGKIGDGIRNAKNKATSGMKSVGNGIISAAGKPFNKVVDGVNWITGKLGIKSKIGQWNIPQFAKGTKVGGHKGGLAIVGDGGGEELIKLPNGKSFLSPATDTMLDLPKGTQVVPHEETKKIMNMNIPHYAKGTGGWKSAIGEVWDYIKNPSKIVSKIMDKISTGVQQGQIPKNMVSSSFNYIKDKPVDFIKKMFKQQEETEHNPNFGGGKPAFGWPMTSNFGYRNHPLGGGRRLHAGVDYGAPMGAPIPSTTGGKVSFASNGYNGGFGNLVKVKSGMMEMFYAHMSKILVSVGQQVKKGTILGRVGSTGDSTGPHLHYETRKNGKAVNPLSLKGFKTGGVVKSKMMAMLGEEGEEIVIPTAPNRRTDAMKLLALAAKKIGADSGSYEKPSSISGNSHTDTKNEELSLLRQQVELLTQLVLKDTTVSVDGNELSRVISPKVSKEINRLNKEGARKLGVIT